MNPAQTNSSVRIDWAWLKQTPEGTWGLIPGVGLRFYHPHRSAVQCSAIYVDNGTECFSIQPRNGGKSWSRVATLGFCEESREELRQRCPDRLAATQ